MGAKPPGAVRPQGGLRPPQYGLGQRTTNCSQATWVLARRAKTQVAPTGQAVRGTGWGQRCNQTRRRCSLGVITRRVSLAQVRLGPTHGQSHGQTRLQIQLPHWAGGQSHGQTRQPLGRRLEVLVLALTSGKLIKIQPGQFCTKCRTGAVVTLGQLSTWTVVALGQLSYLGSCLPGQLSPGQLPAWAVVAWGDVGASFRRQICVVSKC